VAVLESVLDGMRGQGNVYERCLFYYGHSLAEIADRLAPKYTEVAKMAAEDEDDDAEVLQIAREYAEAEMAKVPEVSIPSCGDTSAAVRRLLLDEVFSETPDPGSLSERLQAAQTRVMEIYRRESAGGQAVADTTGDAQDGVRGGIGPDALKAVIMESRGAQLIQVTVEGKGFGHIYDIEQLERERAAARPRRAPEGDVRRGELLRHLPRLRRAVHAQRQGGHVQGAADRRARERGVLGRAAGPREGAPARGGRQALSCSSQSLMLCSVAGCGP
jgi:hypothetical protein